MQSREVAVKLIDEVISQDHAGGVPRIFFFERNNGYDTGQFVSFLNHSLIHRKFILSENGKTELGAEVIPTNGVDQKIKSRDEIVDLVHRTGIKPVSGDIFVALPGYGGNNVQFELNGTMPGNEFNNLISLPTKTNKIKAFFYRIFDPRGEGSYPAYVYILYKPI
jgi:hypothetical protein